MSWVVVVGHIAAGLIVGVVVWALVRTRHRTRAADAYEELRLFRRAVEVSGHAIIITDDSATIEYVNPAFTRITGYDAAEAVGRNVTILSSNEMDEAYFARMWQTLHSGGTWSEDIVNRRRDGTVYRASQTIAPFAGPGHSVQYVAVQTDTTREHELTVQLAERERQYRLLAEHATDMISRHKPDGTYTYVSPAASVLLGYEPEELIGHSAYEYFHPDDVPAIQDSHHSIIETPEYSTVAFRMRQKDGEYVWLETTSRTVRDESDTITELIAITRNIEERVASEQRLERAWEAAESASRAKTEFLAQMSHEIKTPLNAILGYSELLHKRVTDPDLLKWVNLIRNGGANLLKLLNNLLDLGTIESGALSAELAPTSIAQATRDVVEIFRLTAQEKGVKLTLEFKGELPNSVLIDDTRLRQILMNLVANAVKFTAEGSIEVTVEATDRSDGHIDLRIDVADSGIGIAAGELERIFAPFERGRVRPEAGTGLGLAISRHLAELLGGRVLVSSTQGAGSVFTVDLPGLEIGRAVSGEMRPSERDSLGTGDAKGDATPTPGAEARKAIIASVGSGQLAEWRRLFSIRMLDRIATVSAEIERIALDCGEEQFAARAAALGSAAHEYDVDEVDRLCPVIEDVLFGGPE